MVWGGFHCSTAVMEGMNLRWYWAWNVSAISALINKLLFGEGEQKVWWFAS